ncbi:MAG: hypothetical protein Q4D92_07405 [Slackia sp.]|nr:hypothetical protein [Slackia sp.]
MAANTVVLTAADGRVQALPLASLVERNAVLADHVNGEPIEHSFGGFNQLMVPGLPARYFVRDIVSIEFEERDVPPSFPAFEDDGHDFTNRPNVSVQGKTVFRTGETARFEGYADDFDRAIVAVELSFDNGENWLRCATEGAEAGRWVWWTFDWDTEAPGVYQLSVRSVNEDGKKSPIPALHRFTVMES